MKFKTLLGLIVSGQLPVLLSLNSIVRQSYRSSFVAACLSEGIYTYLRDQPASLEQIHQHLFGSQSADNGSLGKLKAWLDLGVTFGELKLTPAGYALHSRLARQLAQPSNDAFAAMVQEACTLHHDLITQTPARLRANRFFAMADLDGELIARSSRILEPYIFEVVDSVVPEKGAIRLLEVGCGSGVHIQRACLRNPDLQAVGLELQPNVADFARKNLQTWGLADRVRIDTGDIRDYANPERFDLVTLHNNIYYFPIPERLDLMRRLANFLKPGGLILVTTGCQGSQSTQVLNLWGEMTEDAGAMPLLDDMRELMVQAGFHSLKTIRLLPGQSFYAFVGTKS